MQVGLRSAILLAALIAAGCSGERPHAERPIEMLVPTDAETLDPRHATDAVALRTTRLLHAGLVKLDPMTLEPTPYLAREWAWLDARSLKVTLRDDVRFHSGAPLRPKDVCETLRAFAAKEVGSRHARVVDAIDRCTPDGEHAVTIHLGRDHATLLTDLEVPILRADEAFAPPRPDGALDGLGPYKVERREHGAIALTPMAHGATLAVTLRTVHDENARALRMHAGRADLVVNGFSPTLLPAMERATDLVVSSRPGANLTYMLANNARLPTSDRTLRLALSAAIDREQIAKTLLTGHAVAARELLPPGHWAHHPLDAFVDPAAQAMIQQKKLTGTHLTLLTSTDRLRGTIARVIAQQISAATGATIEVVPLELGTMLARLSAGDFELATLQLPELTEPNVLRFFMHSSSIPPQGANRARVRDELVDAMLDEGARTLDLAQRKDAYLRIERQNQANAELIPLWHEDHVTVASKRASAFRPSAEGRWLDLAALR